MNQTMAQLLKTEVAKNKNQSKIDYNEKAKYENVDVVRLDVHR